MTRFKDALLAELTASVNARQPAPPHRRSHKPRQLAAAAAVLVAVVVGLGIALGPSHERPAYAVERKPDGTIEFTLNELTDIDGANRALRDAGVRARVMLPVASCPHVGSTGSVADVMGVFRTVSDPRPNVVAIHPNQIPAGRFLYIVPTRHWQREELYLLLALAPESAPPCHEISRSPEPVPSESMTSLPDRGSRPSVPPASATPSDEPGPPGPSESATPSDEPGPPGPSESATPAR